MANPEHTPKMSSLDNLTVILYRVGLSIFTLSCILISIEMVLNIPILGVWYFPITATSMALSCANLHLYVILLRWLVPVMAWLGFIVFVISSNIQNNTVKEYIELISLGFFYATASMFAIKEYFCFKITVLFAVPFLLITTLLLMLLSANFMAGIFLGTVGIIYLWLCIKKWSMPLHFDIGDKSLYQM